MSALLTAIVGGLIGGLFAINAVERQAAESRESEALLLRRQALDSYIQAYAQANFLSTTIYQDASAMAAGEVLLADTAMFKGGNWRPDQFRVQASNFAEIQALKTAQARLLPLFSSGVSNCAERIDASFRIEFWELSNLAEHGNFEWLRDQGIEDPDWRQTSVFKSLFVVTRDALYGHLIELARHEADLDTAAPPGPTETGICARIPYYVADSSTVCDQLSDEAPLRNCFELTLDIWEEAQRGEFRVEDVLSSSPNLGDGT